MGVYNHNKASIYERQDWASASFNSFKAVIAVRTLLRMYGSMPIDPEVFHNIMEAVLSRYGTTP